MVIKKILILLFSASCLVGYSYCSQSGEQPVEPAHELQQVQLDEQTVPAMLPGAVQEAQPVEHVPLYKKAAHAFKRGVDFCRQYPVTTGLMATNIGVFAAQKYCEKKFGIRVIEELFAFSGSTQNQVWRFLTYMFLHGSMKHLFSNSVSLLMTAHLERSLGSKKFLGFYMASGALANLGSLVDKYYCPEKYKGIYLGASGALSGLGGASIVKLARIPLTYASVEKNFDDIFDILRKDGFLAYMAQVFGMYWNFAKYATTPIDAMIDCYKLMRPMDDVGHAHHLAGFATGVGLSWALSD